MISRLLPGKVLAPLSKNVASGIGSSWVWQLHAPLGMLPGFGQELAVEKKLCNMTKLRDYYLRSNSFCYRALVEWRSRRHGSNSQECVWPCRLGNNALAYQKTGLPQMISSWLPQSQEWGCSPQGPPCSCRWDRVRRRWRSTGRRSLFLGHRLRRSMWRWVNSRALLLTRWSRWRRSQRSQRCFWKHCLQKELFWSFWMDLMIPISKNEVMPLVLV